MGNGELVEAAPNAASTVSMKDPSPAQKQTNSQEQPDSEPTILVADISSKRDNKALLNISTQPRRMWKPVERPLSEVQRDVSQLRTGRLPKNM